MSDDSDSDNKDTGDATATADKAKDNNNDDKNEEGGDDKDKEGGEEKAKVSNRDLFGDDSSDDDDDDDDIMVDETKKDTAAVGETEESKSAAAPVSSKPPRRSIHDASSDDDEDDVEFDDNGAVVGLSSSTIAGVKHAKSNKSKGGAEGGDDDDVMEDDFDEGDVVDQKLAVTKHKPVHLTVPAVDAPPAVSPESGKTELYFTRLPNMLGIQPEAFELDTYSAAVEQADYAVHDMVRWRYKRDEAGHLVRTATIDNTDGKLQRESNTRLVEWEDGSWTLHIGKEAFEVDAVNSGGNEFAGLNGYLYLSQTATKQAMPENELDEYNDNDDAEEEPAGTVLECMGPVVSRLVARPSLSSQAHKSLTVAIRQRTIKKARIAEFVTQDDPEKMKQERIQVNTELEKAAARKRGGYGGGGGYSGGGGGGPGGGGRGRAGGRMSRSYLEDDEDFDTTNIKAMKRGQYDEMDDYGEDSESEEERTFHKARPTAAAAGKRKQKDEESSDGDDDMLMDDDDDDEEVAPVAKTNKKRSAQAVIDDDDSDSD
jgi:RNA polymerase-associated protein LEO1